MSTADDLRAIAAQLETIAAGLDVPPPPPPPPSPGLIFSDDFEGPYELHQLGNPGWLALNPPNVSVSTDVSHSGKHSLRFSYPAKPDCADASAEQRFTFGTPLTEVWMEWWIYFPKGGEGGSAPYFHRTQKTCPAGKQSDNNKLLALYGSEYNTPTQMLIQTWTQKALPSGTSRIQSAARSAANGVTMNLDQYPDFVIDDDLGCWTELRLHAKVATVGQKDGVIELWKNGGLILCNTALDWYDPTSNENFLLEGYLMGWSNSGFAGMTNIYIDDIKIWDESPGGW